jgi:hypothetical protein
MNELERALQRTITRLLIAQRWPSGRPMTDAEWWATLEVADVLELHDPELELHRKYTSGPSAESSPGSTGGPAAR